MKAEQNKLHTYLNEFTLQLTWKIPEGKKKKREIRKPLSTFILTQEDVLSVNIMTGNKIKGHTPHSATFNSNFNILDDFQFNIDSLKHQQNQIEGEKQTSWIKGLCK